MNNHEIKVFESSFASDNNSGVHPDILAALIQANQGYVIAYGDDPYTSSAILALKREFGNNAEVFFVMNGTGANVTSLASVTRPFQAIICAQSAHINVDECCSPERFTGCKLLDIPTPDGKLTPSMIVPFLTSLGDEHQAQPAVISITQASECGTVYRPSEIRELTDFAHSHGMILHMDGARLANAASFLRCSLRELSADCGVDLLSFGGTKNGMMYGEAVIFLSPKLAREYKFFRKQGTQLASKMRYIAVQFETLVSNELWRKNANHANTMARLLADSISEYPDVTLVYPNEANGVFVRMPEAAITALLEEYFFYVTYEHDPVARFMTSFDTREEDVKRFSDTLFRIIS